jgi:hypothetical protein
MCTCVCVGTCRDQRLIPDVFLNCSSRYILLFVYLCAPHVWLSLHISKEGIYSLVLVLWAIWVTTWMLGTGLGPLQEHYEFLRLLSGWAISWILHLIFMAESLTEPGAPCLDYLAVRLRDFSCLYPPNTELQACAPIPQPFYVGLGDQTFKANTLPTEP